MATVQNGNFWTIWHKARCHVILHECSMESVHQTKESCFVLEEVKHYIHYYLQYLNQKQFLIECQESKAKVITKANHKNVNKKIKGLLETTTIMLYCWNMFVRRVTDSPVMHQLRFSHVTNSHVLFVMY